MTDIVDQLSDLDQETFDFVQDGLIKILDDAFAKAGKRYINASVQSKDPRVRAAGKAMVDVDLTDVPFEIDRMIFASIEPKVEYDENEIYRQVQDDAAALITSAAVNADDQTEQLLGSPIGAQEGLSKATKIFTAGVAGYIAARIAGKARAVPTLQTRDALTVLGGADTRGLTVKRDRYGRHTYRDQPSYGILYTGAKVQDDLADQNIATGMEWVHITPHETAYPPHESLNGTVFTNASVEDKLTVDGHFTFPGDDSHSGCRCYFRLTRANANDRELVGV